MTTNPIMQEIYNLIDNNDEVFAIDDIYVGRYQNSLLTKQNRTEIKEKVKTLPKLKGEQGISPENHDFNKTITDAITDAKNEQISPSQLILQHIVKSPRLTKEQKKFLFNINYNTSIGEPFLTKTLLHAATKNCDEEMVDILLSLDEWLAPSLLAHINNHGKTERFDAAHLTECSIIRQGKSNIKKKIRDKMDELGIPYISKGILSKGNSLGNSKPSDAGFHAASALSSVASSGLWGGKSKRKRKTAKKTKKQRKTSKKHRKTN